MQLILPLSICISSTLAFYPDPYVNASSLIPRPSHNGLAFRPFPISKSQRAGHIAANPLCHWTNATYSNTTIEAPFNFVPEPVVSKEWWSMSLASVQLKHRGTALE
jgi:hypothetical protein